MCILCDLPVKDEDLIFYIGLDIPYVNILVHRACFKANKDNLNDVLALNVEKVYNYIRELNKSPIKSKKIRRN